jgi:hypothetical protein
MAKKNKKKHPRVNLENPGVGHAIRIFKSFGVDLQFRIVPSPDARFEDAED